MQIIKIHPHEELMAQETKMEKNKLVEKHGSGISGVYILGNVMSNVTQLCGNQQLKTGVKEEWEVK